VHKGTLRYTKYKNEVEHFSVVETAGYMIQESEVRRGGEAGADGGQRQLQHSPSHPRHEPPQGRSRIHTGTDIVKRSNSVKIK
jgi:hypothetical protein